MRSTRGMRTRLTVTAVAAAVVAGGGLATTVTTAAPAEAAPGSIRVITHNLEKNPASVTAVAKIKDATDGPEVIVLQEVCRSLLPQIKTLGYTNFRARKNHKKCDGQAIGEAVVWTGSGGSGRNDATLVRDDGHAYGLACVTFPYAGRTTRACSTHLAAGADKDGVRLKITQKIRSKAATWIREGKRVVVGGDFNSNPKDAAMREMYGVGGGAVGPFREIYQSADEGTTERTGDPTKGGRKIDYIFVSKVDTKTKGGTQKTCGSDCTPSDHRLLWGTAPLAAR